MIRKKSGWMICFVVLMFIFSAFMAWYLPSSSSLRSRIAETERNLETSRGRENKQQDEYDKALEELPLVQSELEIIQPQAEAAAQTAADLKSRRKELREQKQELEAEQSVSVESKEDADE